VLEKRLLPHGRRAGAPLGRVAWLRAVAISFAISGVMVGGIAATSGASGATAAPQTSAAAGVVPATTTTSTAPASHDVPQPGTADATTTTTTSVPPPPPPVPAPAPAPAPAPPVATPVAAPAPAPAPPPAPAVSALPARGEATASGCAAALAYLAAYAAPGFTFACPGYALGHEAMTCINEPGACPGENLIAIADPCAHAYMNEASNSWVLTGQSSAPIDPYGPC
jgi:outer membrane biosynthesis protein TonB